MTSSDGLLKIDRYSSLKSAEWDEFVRSSRNGTFLFLRGYMDYHSDRFNDHSLMYYNVKGRLMALLPANETEENGKKIIHSHQGLTYGGLVLAPKTHGGDVLHIFDETVRYLSRCGFSEWHYKQIPFPYHHIPSEDDEYALWRHNAELIGCGLSTCINLSTFKPVANSRNLNYKKLHRLGYRVVFDTDIKLFWPVLTENLLNMYGADPVHTIDEILLLKKRFPENIQCCCAFSPDGNLEAGAILYLTDTVVHTQYLSASSEGKRTKAMDFLLFSLIGYYQNQVHFCFFDMGTSMGKDGCSLHESLLEQKEGFGGRSIAYKTWKLLI